MDEQQPKRWIIGVVVGLLVLLCLYLVQTLGG